MKYFLFCCLMICYNIGVSQDSIGSNKNDSGYIRIEYTRESEGKQYNVLIFYFSKKSDIGFESFNVYKKEVSFPLFDSIRSLAYVLQRDSKFITIQNSIIIHTTYNTNTTVYESRDWDAIQLFFKRLSLMLNDEVVWEKSDALLRRIPMIISNQ